VIEVIGYVTEAGVSPFQKWLHSLDGTSHGRVLTATYRLAEGNFSSVKGVGSGVYELRMDFGAGYRVYFGKVGDKLVLLLGGGTKKRQSNDIEAAHAAWIDYKNREKAKNDNVTSVQRNSQRKSSAQRGPSRLSE
jgi:putative addiction module killer protein